MKNLCSVLAVCIVTCLCGVVEASGLKMPNAYTPDAHTVGLWHFDEVIDATPGRPLIDAIDSSGNGYDLPEAYPSNDSQRLYTVPSLMGRSITGFVSGLRLYSRAGGLQNKKAQTLEAWVMWDEASLLPQNRSRAQRLFFRNSGSGYPSSSQQYNITFAQSGSDAVLNIYQMDRLQTGPSSAKYYMNDTFTVNLGQLIEEDVWYHVAVSNEVGLDLNGIHPAGSAGDDVRIRVYFNSQYADDPTPAPFAEFLYLDTGDADRPGGTLEPDYTFMVGNPYAEFRGYIDEMRYSDIARTQFDTISVPEPMTLTLLGLGLAGLVARRRR